MGRRAEANQCGLGDRACFRRGDVEAPAVADARRRAGNRRAHRELARAIFSEQIRRRKNLRVFAQVTHLLAAARSDSAAGARRGDALALPPSTTPLTKIVVVRPVIRPRRDRRKN